jgi:phage-related protein (TIGR01555 family)
MSNKRHKQKNPIKTAPKELKLPEARGDGWGNVMTAIGASNSRVNATTYGFAPRLDERTLTNIYSTDSTARRVINIIIDDALRGFINAEDKLLEELKRLKVKQKIIEAATWARVFGGSALVVFADDGQDMEKPLNTDRLKKIISIQSYDRWRLTFSPTDISQDFYSEHYGHPELYTINPINGIPFKVHRTRMHLFGGERVPLQQYINNNRWDDSVLQSLYEPLRNYGQTMNATAEIVQDFIQTVLGVNGLTEMLEQGNEKLVIDRLNLIDLSRSVANTVVLDSQNETYSKHASSVAGLADLLEKQQEVISSGSGQPMTKLFGNTSKGLGASGQNDPDNWNNTVDAYRGDTLESPITWLVDLVEKQSLWTDKPESFDWSFPSLKVSNEHEVVKNRLMTAQMDEIYMNRGAVDPDILYKKRYMDGGFEIDIFFSPEELDEIGDLSESNEFEEQELQRSTNEVKEQIANAAKQQSNSDSLNELENAEKVLHQKLIETCINTLEGM